MLPWGWVGGWVGAPGAPRELALPDTLPITRRDKKSTKAGNLLPPKPCSLPLQNAVLTTYKFLRSLSINRN